MTRAAILYVTVIGITACGADSIPAPRNVEKPPSLDSLVIVSDAAPQSSLSSTAALTVHSEASVTFSYVSLPEGSAAEGVVAAIRNRNGDTSLTVAMVGGGFDPVAVAGQAGDTLDLNVNDANGGTILSGISTIPANKKPVVVRTAPPPRKRDVPLNTIVTIVFSEPMDPQTVTVGSLRLLRNTEVVAAQVVLDPNGTHADLVPQDSLAPGTLYTVLLANTLADRSGERLDPSTFDFTSESPPPPGSGQFVLTGSMSVARYAHTATLLPDGRVLIAGGFDTGGLSTAELYDPTTGTFAPTGGMLQPRSMHTATLLQNGQVLIVGGWLPLPLTVGAELYDPASGTFAATGALLRQQFVRSATLLPNGMVLVAGDTTAELYDPATGTFRQAAAYARTPTIHRATLLADGRVLLAGDAIGQIYDPARDVFELTPPLVTDVVYVHASALLDDGRVLIAGGTDVMEDRLSAAALFDPATNAFVRTSDMLDDRTWHTAVKLPDGKVLIIGGETNGNIGFGGSLRTTELYDPASATFAPGASMVVPRSVHQATRLMNGDVLITGGVHYYNCDTGCNSIDFLASAELYRTSQPMPAVSQRRHAP